MKSHTNNTMAKLGITGLKIITLLDKERMHVNELRAALDDFGAISKYLGRLEDLGLIKREKIGIRIVNTITPKGKRVLKTLQSLEL